MQINIKADDQSQVQGFETQQMGFDVAKQAKLFHMLSNTLYTDKLSAVIRELCSNAFDSHVMAGCADAPIHITVPTFEKPVLVISDSGIGLTKEEALKTILCYLGSNKDTSNDFVGGWGIGSKSPFAYTNTYDVEVVKAGVSVAFTCWKDEHGLPQVIVSREGLTDRHDGVIMSVPISASDLHTCLCRVREYMQWTNYNVVTDDAGGSTPAKAITTIEFDDFVMKTYPSADYNTRGAILLVYGGYSYRIEEVLSGHDQSDLFDNLKKSLKPNVRVAIVVKQVSAVDFSMNRETLEHTAKSKKFVRDAVTAIWDVVSLRAKAYGPVIEAWGNNENKSVKRFSDVYEEFLTSSEDENLTRLAHSFAFDDKWVSCPVAAEDTKVLRGIHQRLGLYDVTLQLGFSDVDKQFTIYYSKVSVVPRRALQWIKHGNRHNALFVKAPSEADAKTLLAAMPTFGGYDVTKFAYSEIEQEAKAKAKPADRAPSELPKFVIDAAMSRYHNYDSGVAYVITPVASRATVAIIVDILAYGEAVVPFTPTKSFMSGKHKKLPNILEANDWITRQLPRLETVVSTVRGCPGTEELTQIIVSISDVICDLDRNAGLARECREVFPVLKKWQYAHRVAEINKKEIDDLVDATGIDADPCLAAAIVTARELLRRYNEIKETVPFFNMERLRHEVKLKNKAAEALVLTHNLGDIL